MDAITWWDLADGGWLNAPAGLIRKDSSSKPAYEELLRLVKGEWWMSPTHFITDGEGKVYFRGFLGEYEMHWESKRIPFKLDTKGATSIKIQI